MDNKVLKIDDTSKVEGRIGQKVTVTGSVDGDTIKVESVKAAD
jgi:endonuclease YncB( thermonuclease family)